MTITYNPVIVDDKLHIVNYYGTFQYGSESFTADQVINFLNAQSCELVILYYNEPGNLQKNKIIDVINLTHLSNKKVVWLLDDCLKVFKHLISENAIVYYYDYMLLIAYKNIVLEKTAATNTSWAHDSEKFLFLTGKPDKVHRIGLLHKFYLANLLSSSVWSLFINDYTKKQSRKILNYLPDDEFRKFVSDHIRNPDDIRVINHNNNSCHYGGFPYNVNLFKKTKFRVISETSISPTIPYSSEKTWITMANYQPFIIVSGPGTIQMLKDKGYKTFEEYLLIKDYNDISQIDLHLDAIVKNTKYWLDHIQDFQEEIIKDTNHNALHWKTQAELQITNIKKMFIDIGIPNCNFWQALVLYDELAHADWPAWYNRIRDPNWPDCPNEEDFVNLPEWIQKECIEVFDYTPKEKNDEKN